MQKYYIIKEGDEYLSQMKGIKYWTKYPIISAVLKYNKLTGYLQLRRLRKEGIEAKLEPIENNFPLKNDERRSTRSSC